MWCLLQRVLDCLKQCCKRNKLKEEMKKAFPTLAVLTALFLACAFYQAMFVAPTDALQGDVYRIIYYHVPSAWTAFVFFAVNFVASIVYLVRRNLKADAVAVSAAEVGLKRLIVDIAPVTRWLMEELPSPPLVQVMTHYLPELEIRAPVPRQNRCPKGLRKSLQAAVEARNRVVHRGECPGLSLYATLRSVKEFLYLLDYYRGHEWAAAYLSEETLRELRRSKSDPT